MKILLVHNTYQQTGGEDVVVEAERELLVNHGHDVRFYGVSNDSVRGVLKKLVTAWEAPYSSAARSALGLEIKRFCPDVVHVHNVFPLLTPSIYDACQDAEVPVVQTLHNFRTICPGALLLRGKKICEECIVGNPYRAVPHRCYRGDFLASLAVARMVHHHRRRKTWQEKVDCFIALTDFAKTKFVEAGFPSEKIAVKPNFIASSAPVLSDTERAYVLFVGRLSEEKGVRTMMEAWERMDGIPLKIVGDGPMAPWVREKAELLPNVEWLGRKGRSEVQSLMAGAVALIFPSIWYEGFPMTIVEAYAAGLPVIAGNIGSMAILITDGVTGLHFVKGSAKSLASQVEWAFGHLAEMAAMGRKARAEFDAKYSAQENYSTLVAIYRAVIGGKKGDRE